MGINRFFTHSDWEIGCTTESQRFNIGTRYSELYRCSSGKENGTNLLSSSEIIIRCPCDLQWFT